MEFLSTISLRNSAVNYVVPRGRGVLIWEPSVATGLDGLTVVFNEVFLGLLTGHLCLLYMWGEGDNCGAFLFFVCNLHLFVSTNKVGFFLESL